MRKLDRGDVLNKGFIYFNRKSNNTLRAHYEFIDAIRCSADGKLQYYLPTEDLTDRLAFARYEWKRYIDNKFRGEL